MSEIKLLLDENMPLSLTQQLNLREIDAVSVKGLSMKGEGDESVLERAIEEGRALVTFDRDFISGLDEKYDHKGIILFTKLLTIGDMLGELQKVIDSFEAEEMDNTVLYLPWD
ncbi:MAG: DUF5615 family PIN-like protein [Thermoplasmatota archaeon]